MLINIRGTSGAGKTTVARQLMEHYGPAEKVIVDGKIEGYICGPIAVVGRYETACGGCDSVPTQDEVCRRVRKYADMGLHVVYEGLLVGAIYGRYAKLADEYPSLFVSLTTPLEECIERVKARRLAAGNMKPLNTKNTEDKYKQVLSNTRKFKEGGYNVIECLSDEAAERIISWIDQYST